MTKGARHYYAVRYMNETRISNKAASPQDACKEVYGMFIDGAYIKSLGSNKSNLQTQKWLNYQLEDRNGWVVLGVVLKDGKYVYQLQKAQPIENQTRS
jgi:hypothetical protein